NNNSGTDYNQGMQFAADTFKTGRPAADFTLIFLSDGEPMEGDGIAIAATMKNPGVPVGGVNKPVIIGSVILGDADPTAIQAVASVDPVTGRPIFAKADSPGDLAAIVTTLANNINSAQLFHGGDTDAAASVDIMSALDFTTYKFE